MREQENKILNEREARYPFTVPDKYFDNLTSRVMAQIPEDNEETATAHTEASTAKVVAMNSSKRWIRVLSIAASLILVAVISFKVFPMLSVSSNQEAQNTEVIEIENLYEDDLLNYAMVDEYDVYNYLSNNQEEIY